MIRSMTAFGRAVKYGTEDGKNITVELKSVNNRYLDCSVKISRAYSFLEDRVRQYVQANGISRGKLDVYVGVEVVENVGMTVGLDKALAESYIAALRALRDEFGLKDDISVMTVAQNRDIFNITKPEEDAERDWQIIKPVIDEAIAAFIKVREAEGEKLKADILSHADEIERLTAIAEERSPKTVAEYRAKLEQRMKEVLANENIDEGRILTEAAIFADKVAVNEELVRLKSHISQLRTMLESSEPVGRKLDFLVQEFNREANTLGSKGNDIEMARIVVDMKAEIEKIREQIQNVE